MKMKKEAPRIEIAEKFAPLWTSDSRYYVITGGRGSAKSFTVGLFAAMLTWEPVPHRILMTRYTLKSASLSIIPEFMEKVHIMGKAPFYKITKSEAVNLITKSDVIFSGIKTSSGNQTANLKSLQGVDTWILDEAEEMDDEEVFETINLSIRSKKHQNRIILILNPTDKQSWIYKRFFLERGVPGGWNGTKDGVTYIHTTYLDNFKNLPEDYIRDIQLIKKNNPKKYEHVIMGGWVEQREGVIFTNWKIGEFDESLPYIYGQDYGFSVDPTTLVKVAVDKKKKIIYADLAFYETGLSTDQTAYMNQEHIERLDDLIIGDSAEPRLISELRNKHGLNIKEAYKPPGSVAEGLNLMRDYQIIVTPTSSKLIIELNSYIWNDKRANVPEDDYNHCIDAMRYAFDKLIKNPRRVR